MKILVKFPSRSRPERFFRSLDTIYQLAYDPANIYVLVSADTDDHTMMNSYVYTKIVSEYNNIKVVYGKSDSKIDAINRDINQVADFWAEAADWDIIMVLSDDIRMTLNAWDEVIRMEMKSNFPHGDGYLHFCEKDTKTALNVMEIMDRTYYERFGFIYHPSYKSLWCDNEKTELAKMLRRYKYIDMEIFVHENPAYGHSFHHRDELFDKQQSLWGVDEANFLARKAIRFEIEKWQKNG